MSETNKIIEEITWDNPKVVEVMALMDKIFPDNEEKAHLTMVFGNILANVM